MLSACWSKPLAETSGQHARHEGDSAGDQPHHCDTSQWQLAISLSSSMPSGKVTPDETSYSAAICFGEEEDSGSWRSLSSKRYARLEGDPP